VGARNGRKHTLSFEICKKFFMESVLKTRGWVLGGQVLTTWLAAGNWAKGPNLEGWGGKGIKREGSRAKRGQSSRHPPGNDGKKFWGQSFFIYALHAGHRARL